MLLIAVISKANFTTNCAPGFRGWENFGVLFSRLMRL